MAALNLGQSFANFTTAEEAITAFCQQNCHPIRLDKRETFKAANKKFKNLFTDVAPDAVYSCRYAQFY